MYFILVHSLNITSNHYLVWWLFLGCIYKIKKVTKEFQKTFVFYNNNSIHIYSLVLCLSLLSPTLVELNHSLKTISGSINPWLYNRFRNNGLVMCCCTLRSSHYAWILGCGCDEQVWSKQLLEFKTNSLSTLLLLLF